MVRINVLHDKIDVAATAINAEQVLSDYQHRRALVRRTELAAIHSPVADGMPHGRDPHAVEEQIIRGVDNEAFVEQCQNVVAAIGNEEYRDMLKWLYLTPLPTAGAIMERMGMSTTAYYHAKKNALVAFAELWPPSPSELLVYSTGKGR